MRVIAVVRDGAGTASKIEGIENVEIIRCNMEDYNELAKKLPKTNYDTFYHFAWEGIAGPS